MKVLCPNCETIFKISDAQLNLADGYVQCGQCEEIFNALEQTQASKSPNQDLFEEDLMEASKEIDNDDTSQSLDPKALRQTLLGTKPSNPWETTAWTASCVFFILMLAIQYIYIKRNQMVADNPQLAPYIVSSCESIPGCKINPKRDLGKIELVSRNIYTHPNIDGVLIINAVLANTANYSQPYPVLLVSMSNVRGKIIAQRYFQPSEYLIKTQNNKNLLQEGATTSVNIEILDPGNDALAFELDFL